MKNKKQKTKSYKYMVSIYWSHEDDVYVANVPELPGCMTHGDSFAAAAKNAEDAIASWIDAAGESGVEIPEPIAEKSFSGKFLFRLRPATHRLIAIKAAQKGQSINGYALALIERGLEEDRV